MGEKTRVLFVDDEENILKALRRLFRREPWEQRFASSGAEALGLLEADGSFDVVVTDQRMPGMTGVELLKEIRKRLPDCVRIVLSGYSDVQSILDAVNEGAIYKFMTKPWDDEVLREVVSDAVRSAGLRRENERLHSTIEDQNAELLAMNGSLRQACGRESGAVVPGLACRVLEALPLGVVAVGGDGSVALTNETARRVLGSRSPEDLVGRRWDPEVLEGGGDLRLLRAEELKAGSWRGTVYLLLET
jgi:response regulator RpfG family c-di-GMP phosphodiesterase